MKLRRFEFGITQTSEHHVEVQARRGDGAVFVRTFSREEVDVLAVAEADLVADAKSWKFIPPRADSKGLSLVWDEGAHLYISGEAAVTTDALLRVNIDLIISMNIIKPETRERIATYLNENPRATHHPLPILDVLPKFQRREGLANATRALELTSRALAEGKSVLVHCLMGIHRSVSVSAVALTRAGLAPSPRTAFLKIQGRRHVASWIPETVEWLSSFPADTGIGE